MRDRDSEVWGETRSGDAAPHLNSLSGSWRLTVMPETNPQKPKGKRKRGRPRKRPMPEAIPDTPENVLKALVAPWPPDKPGRDARP